MTIQEIKGYINSRLGGVLKCVLPSYWWKKFFGIVLDRMEESEKQTQVQLDKIAIKQDAYKNRRLVADDEDIEGSTNHNIEVFGSLWTELFMGGLTKAAKEPIYVLTHPINGERLLSYVPARGLAVEGSSNSYQGIDVYDVPYGDRVVNIRFKNDGTYIVDYGRKLYYSTDASITLTDEEKSSNSDLVNKLSNGGTGARIEPKDILCYNKATGRVYQAICADSITTFYPKFYVLEYDRVVKVSFSTGSNIPSATIIGTLNTSGN